MHQQTPQRVSDRVATQLRALVEERQLQPGEVRQLGGQQGRARGLRIGERQAGGVQQFLHGGVERRFAPVTGATLAEPALRGLVLGLGRVASAALGHVLPFVEVADHRPGRELDGPALLRRTVDGGVWIGQARLADPPGTAPGQGHFKQATAELFATEAAALPQRPAPLMRPDDEWAELRYTEHGPEGARVGCLSFDFYNGAMSTARCERLRAALLQVRERPTQVLLLLGGEGFFSNGIDLNSIEAAAHRPGDSAADASWRNIHAMNDVALAVLQTTDRLTVSVLRGNAGAGGAFLALAADQVWAHGSVVLNPHYKNMGNLYGSEYWTYLLPRRLGEAGACDLMAGRLPLRAADALTMGLIVACDDGPREGLFAFDDSL